MAGLRWRAPTILTLLVVFALCFSLQQAPNLSAKDKAKPGKSALSADDASDSSAASGDSANTANKKTKTAAEKKKSAKKKKGKQGADDSDDSSTSSQSGNSSGSGVVNGGSGGQSGGTGTNAAAIQNGANVPKTGNRGVNGGNPPVAPNPGNGGRGQPPPARLDANHPVVRKVIAIQNSITPDLLKQKGIVGTSTGLDEDGNVVIRVQTTGADNPKIPKQVQGVAVVEVLTGPIRPYWQPPVFNQKAFQTRPSFIGVSAFDDVDLVGGCAAGTLGCRLRDKQGNVYGLSNNHVFAGENGTEGGVQIGTLVVQPSPGDDIPICAIGVASHVIGKLFRFKPLIPGGADNLIDAAIISTDVSLVGNSTPPPPVAYGTPRTITWIGPFLGQNVQKLGRSSGYTTGFVVGLNQMAVVPYTPGLVFFVQQIEFAGSNAPSLGIPGDSGSLIVTNDVLGERFPIALLFAGGGGLTLGNPIQAVLDYFDMTIDGDDTPVIPSPGKEGQANTNLP